MTITTAAGASSPRADGGHVRVVASGLDNPRGLGWGGRGILLVAEAGRGGDGPCLPGVLTPEPMCFGTTGAVTAIGRFGAERVVEDLPSLAPSGGGPAFGPADVTGRAGRPGAYVLLGGPADPANRGRLPPEAALLGTLQRVDGNRTTLIADIATFEAVNDPDRGDVGSLVQSNPTSVAVGPRGQLVVTDAAANTVLRVSDDRLSLLATLRPRTADVNGVPTTFQAVPSAVAVGPDGAVYVAELTGEPFPEGASRVVRLRDSGPVPIAEDLSAVVDIALDRRGNLYVVEIFAGRVLRIDRRGHRTVLIDQGLTMPAGIAVAPDGSVYVSNCSVCAGQGEVLRIGP